MKLEALVILYTTLGIVLFSYIFLALKVVWEVHREKKWARALDRPKLLKLEDLLGSCLEDVQIDVNDTTSIESLIEQQGYTVKYRTLVLFREAYTSKKPRHDIYIRRFLPAERRHFALAHELMHIIYKPEELEDKSLSRDIHSFFKERNEHRQNQDYMASSLILQKDTFWDEIVRADYFNLPVRERKEFAFQAAQKYNVEPSVVFRRISELKALNN